MNLYDDITDFIFTSDAPRQSDMIFVVGGTFPEPAERAAELILGGYAKNVLVSGKYSEKVGKFPGASSKQEKYNLEYKTESGFFSDVLTKNGVDKSSIICENMSGYTFENAMWARKLTLDMNIKNAILCCQSFHARRALMYYEHNFPDTTWIVCPADTQGITKGNWYCSEKGINIVMGELSRIGEQFREIFIENMKG